MALDNGMEIVTEAPILPVCHGLLINEAPALSNSSLSAAFLVFLPAPAEAELISSGFRCRLRRRHFDGLFLFLTACLGDAPVRDVFHGLVVPFEFIHRAGIAAKVTAEVNRKRKQQIS